MTAGGILHRWEIQIALLPISHLAFLTTTNTRREVQLAESVPQDNHPTTLFPEMEL